MKKSSQALAIAGALAASTGGANAQSTQSHDLVGQVSQRTNIATQPSQAQLLQSHSASGDVDISIGVESSQRYGTYGTGRIVVTGEQCGLAIDGKLSTKDRDALVAAGCEFEIGADGRLTLILARTSRQSDASAVYSDPSYKGKLKGQQDTLGVEYAGDIGRIGANARRGSSQGGVVRSDNWDVASTFITTLPNGDIQYWDRTRTMERLTTVLGQSWWQRDISASLNIGESGELMLSGGQMAIGGRKMSTWSVGLGLNIGKGALNISEDSYAGERRTTVGYTAPITNTGATWNVSGFKSDRDQGIGAGITIPLGDAPASVPQYGRQSQAGGIRNALGRAVSNQSNRVPDLAVVTSVSTTVQQLSQRDTLNHTVLQDNPSTLTAPSVTATYNSIQATNQLIDIDGIRNIVYILTSASGQELARNTTGVFAGLTENTQYKVATTAETLNRTTGQYESKTSGFATIQTLLSPDTTPAVITLSGGDMTLLTGATFVDPGATCLDNRDGDCTSLVVVSGVVDINTPGVYYRTYTYTDKAGNKASVTRKVTVNQKNTLLQVGNLGCTASVITVGQSTGCIIDVKDTDGIQSVTATINGVAATVVQSGSQYSIQVLGDTPGLKTIVWNVVSTNAQGGTETGSATQTVSINLPPDTTAPIITLSGAQSITITQGDSFVDPGATCTDNRDPSCTVVTTGTVDPNTPGVYTITYTAIDAAGNAATPIVRTVTVLEQNTLAEGTLTCPTTMTVGDNVSCIMTATDPQGIASVVWMVDGAQVATGTSPLSLSTLSVGAHTIDVIIIGKKPDGTLEAPVVYTKTVNTIAQNTAPTAITLTPSSPLTAGSLTAGQLVGTLSCTDFAPTGPQNTCTYSGGNVEFSVSANGEVRVLDPNMLAGTKSISVIATDAQGQSKNVTLSITVDPAPNTAPVMPSIPAVIATVGTAGSRVIPAATDAEGNTLTYSVVGSLPTGFSFDAGTRTLSWTIGTVAGNYSFGIRANDGSLNSNTSTVAITVNAAPDTTAPSPTSSLSLGNFSLGQSLTRTINFDEAIATATISGLPNGVTATRTISGSTVTITLSVDPTTYNFSSATDTIPFTLTVTDAANNSRANNGSSSLSDVAPNWPAQPNATRNDDGGFNPIVPITNICPTGTDQFGRTIVSCTVNVVNPPIANGPGLSYNSLTNSIEGTIDVSNNVSGSATRIIQVQGSTLTDTDTSTINIINNL